MFHQLFFLKCYQNNISLISKNICPYNLLLQLICLHGFDRIKSFFENRMSSRAILPLLIVIALINNEIKI